MAFPGVQQNMAFRVIRIPRIVDAFSNFVFVSERMGIFMQHPQYVSFDDSKIICMVKTLPDIHDSEIAMNSLQRRETHLVINQQTNLIPVDVKNEPSIHSARIYICLKSNRHATVQANVMIVFLLANFQNHVFAEQQEVPIQFGSFTMTFRIDSMQNADGVRISRGMLRSTTQLSIYPMNPLLRFIA
jgi:hypothetical protein